MGAMNILKTVGLIGRDGVLSKSSPGVFIQGLLVYGRNGQEIFRRNLDPDFYREAFLYSLKHDIPLVAYCGDRCLTLFDHPLVEAVHSVYCEPKAEIMPTVESLLAAAEIQKRLNLFSMEHQKEMVSNCCLIIWELLQRRSWQLAMEKMALKCSGWLGLELLSAMDQRRQKLLLM
uniref:Uncharacterized protein n=1 Tax=Opuntia streptacantha TaxID=393608 RepID=A0A7C8ZTB0_OPUST